MGMNELSPGLPPTQEGTGPDQLPLSRQEMAAFPDILPPLVQKNCTVTPGAVEDVFMETLAGVDKGLHGTEETEKDGEGVHKFYTSLFNFWLEGQHS